MTARAATGPTVRDGREEDLPALLAIYNDAVLNSSATFDLAPLTLEQRRGWFDSHRGPCPLVVVEKQGEAVGYATLSRFREKPGYSRTAESSVYVHPGHRGEGVGSAAMREVIGRARELGYHTVVAGIVPPNEPCVRLHTRLGFQHIGDFLQVGFKFGRWLDVGWYQLFLDGDRTRP